MKIKVTTVDANHIKVEFNDYYTMGATEVKVAFYNRADIELVEVYDDYVRVHVLDISQDWELSDVGDLDSRIFQVDNIDGTTSWNNLTKLGEQIAALMIA